jgi:hypothetical protein
MDSSLKGAAGEAYHLPSTFEQENFNNNYPIEQALRNLLVRS